MAKDRYVSFGERMGVVATLALGTDEVTPRFRNAVWNQFGRLFESDGTGLRTAPVIVNRFLMGMAIDKRWPVHEYEYLDSYDAKGVLRTWLLTEASWYEVYEFLERFPVWARFSEQKRSVWETEVDDLLFAERSPYRFANHELTLIVADDERQEASQAAGHVGPFAIASEHIAKALQRFSARPNPDYENAIKEAVSGMESALTVANGKRLDFGPACDAFAKSRDVHSALMKSASNLFGYANDEGGIRHGKKAAGDGASFNEAKLVIVSASAWVNFIAQSSGTLGPGSRSQVKPL